MKRRFLSVVAALALCLMSASIAAASGYALYEFSARGNALGGALVARADDPSALVFNPAGITQLEGTHIAAGASLFIPKLDLIHGGETFEVEDRLWTIPHFYLTHQINDRFTIGVAEYSRFGLGTDLDENWNGRFNTYQAIIESFSINPNIAMKLNDKVSVAAGVEYTRVAVELRNALSIGGSEYKTHLESDGYGFGLTAGLHYKPSDEWRFGVSWKSQVEVVDKGTQKFSGAPGMKDSDVRGTVTVPDMFFFGAAWYPTDKLSIEAGAVLTRWSLYDNLAFHYHQAQVGGTTHILNAQKEWHDSWRFNVGIEYDFTENWTGRVGYVYDQSPINEEYVDYMIPGNDRQLYSAGLGYKWDNWSIDASYTFVWAKGRDYSESKAKFVDKNGRAENGNTHIYGLTVGYHF